MARFILITSVAGAPPDMADSKWPRGVTIASNAGSARESDVVSPALGNPIADAFDRAERRAKR